MVLKHLGIPLKILTLNYLKLSYPQIFTQQIFTHSCPRETLCWFLIWSGVPCLSKSPVLSLLFLLVSPVSSSEFPISLQTPSLQQFPCLGLPGFCPTQL